MTPAEQAAREKKKRPRAALARKPVWACGVLGLRTALGLSQRDVAAKTGISHGNIPWIEKGYDLTLTTALALAAFFGKSIDDLWKPLREKKD